ncbi:MAG TPA: hypothetical protein VFP61_04270 [Acidimicrobiales bacterium]|nr:hypothetical protein [Acidimicrobiales bacterium]
MHALSALAGFSLVAGTLVAVAGVTTVALNAMARLERATVAPPAAGRHLAAGARAGRRA